MTKLVDIFTDITELEMAEAVLSVVPEDAGKWNNSQARVSAIVMTIYREDVDTDFDERTKYCEERRILPRLMAEGFVASGGCFGRENLYVTPRAR